MNLRTRLRLGYLYLVALLLATAGGSALEFHRFGRGLERDLTQAYGSADAAVAMLGDLEREHEAVEGIILGRADAHLLLDAARAGLAHNLDEAERYASLKGEETAIARLKNGLEAYRAVIESALSRPEGPSVEDYETRAYPSLMASRSAIVELLKLNHAVMSEAGARARQGAWRRALSLASLVTIALLSFAALSRALQRTVIDPLDELRKTAEAVAQGETQRRVLVHTDDELGLVGRQLNALLDRQADLLSESAGRVTAQKQLLLSLVGASEMPVAVLGIDGKTVVSRLSEADTERLEVIADHLRERSCERVDGMTPVLADKEIRLPAGGRLAVCRPLATPMGRPTGWIVRFTDVHSA